MSDDPELSGFVREHMRSVWAVELLLILRREKELMATVLKVAEVERRKIQELAEAERQKLSIEATGRAEARRLEAQGEADAIIDSKGLKQVTDSGAIEAIIDEVLAANAAMVAEFRAGKDKAFNALVGQAMKASKGKANPAQVNEMLRKKLG